MTRQENVSAAETIAAFYRAQSRKLFIWRVTLTGGFSVSALLSKDSEVVRSWPRHAATARSNPDAVLARAIRRLRSGEM